MPETVDAAGSCGSGKPKSFNTPMPSRTTKQCSLPPPPPTRLTRQ